LNIFSRFVSHPVNCVSIPISRQRVSIELWYIIGPSSATPVVKLDNRKNVTHSALMATITIRELHMKTGHWVRTAARGRQGVLVLDRGRPAARLLPVEEDAATGFAQRELVPGFERLPAIAVDSARLLEEDRR